MTDNADTINRILRSMSPASQGALIDLADCGCQGYGPACEHTSDEHPMSGSIRLALKHRDLVLDNKIITDLGHQVVTRLKGMRR